MLQQDTLKSQAKLQKKVSLDEQQKCTGIRMLVLDRNEFSKISALQDSKQSKKGCNKKAPQ